MTMTTITLRDKLAALEAERDLLRAQLAKARHHKKPYEEMTTEEYRATLNKLGLSIVASAEHLGLSPASRSATPTEHHLSPTRSRSSTPRHPNRLHRRRSQGHLI